ncbi:hypothetical protein Q664_27260 [Archangium violaceum Cb vi76]|uniref:Uncharacterized protein n=1 Tax=Archangium violaceum Cb vi76 TaxID=1406225 RepID=A0A084SQ31_9BACT|nr:hypothetical protein Q664_27260 [Archangium violaceum Cb vi76]
MTVALSSTSGQRIFKDALAVRNTVFRDEEHLSTRPDQDEYDELPSATHVVVYVNSEPAAAARLLLPSERVARTRGGHFGLPLEQLLDLASLKSAGMRPAESGRVAVLKKYRKSEVIVWLLASIYWASRNTGVNAWVAAANGETDVPRDARLIARVASAQQLDSPVRVHALAPSSPPANPAAAFYNAAHWELARQSRFSELPLPGVLKLFTQKMGARLMGSPLYIPEFSRWAYPLCAWLNEIPRSTLEQFDALAQSAHRAP